MEKTGRWTLDEHNLFIQGLQIHGKAWKKISTFVRTRSVVQVRTHAQKYFLKIRKNSPHLNDYKSYEDLKFSPNSMIQKKSSHSTEKDIPPLLRSFYQQPNPLPATSILRFPFQTDVSKKIEDFSHHYSYTPPILHTQETEDEWLITLHDSDYSDVIDPTDINRCPFDSELDRDSSVEGLDLLSSLEVSLFPFTSLFILL
jgi:SHAQKYF class myb-like DNA-binding protein